MSIRGRYCIDRYEAYTALMLPRGRLRRHSPFKPVDNKKVKALNRRGRMPQAYISRNEAEQACNNSGKRLCTDEEWITACKGKRPTTWPYGKDHKPGRCNDKGVSSFNMYFGVNGKEAPKSAYTWENLNDPRLNKPKGTCAPSGRFKRCRNSFKVYAMVGNLHEWTASASGTFRGGYFLDVRINGDGCDYKTTAHGPKYHDYSTGFRCCKTPGVRKRKRRKAKPAKKARPSKTKRARKKSTAKKKPARKKSRSKRRKPASKKPARKKSRSKRH